MAEITIIGSGMAAVAAVVAAREQGEEVTLCKGSPGATALSSGAWDIAGDPLRHAHTPWDNVPSPLQNLQNLIERNPFHPYRLLQTDANEFQQAVDKVSRALSYRLTGSLQEGFLALTPMGTLKATAFVPHYNGMGNLLKMSGGRLLLVGFKGINSFFVASAAPLLQEKLKRNTSSNPPDVSAVEIFPDLRFTSPFELASRLDGPWQEAFHQKILELVQEHRPTHVALPPVMGIKGSAQILSRLYELTGVRCFETLALPPSVPGLRLQNAIDRYLQEGCRVITGRVSGVTRGDGTVKALQCTHEGKTATVEVKRVILATGKYIGGGLTKEAAFEEPLFDLPLFLGDRPIKKVFVGNVVKRNFLSAHPLFEVGVRANRQLQPVNERNETLYDNLWVAGSILRGNNPATDHSGMGTALVTGTMAARFASARLTS